MKRKKNRNILPSCVVILTNSDYCFESRVSISVLASFPTIGVYLLSDEGKIRENVHFIAAFSTIFRIAGGFRYRF